eukprot:1101707-Pyramimonas_sp.AAC.1
MNLRWGSLSGPGHDPRGVCADMKFRWSSLWGQSHDPREGRQGHGHRNWATVVERGVLKETFGCWLLVAGGGGGGGGGGQLGHVPTNNNSNSSSNNNNQLNTGHSYSFACHSICISQTLDTRPLRLR